MTPQRLRAYVLIVMRDILPPLTGVFLSVYLPLSHQFELWQLPLLAGLFGVPLVSAGGPPSESATQAIGSTVGQLIGAEPVPATPAETPAGEPEEGGGQ